MGLVDLYNAGKSDTTNEVGLDRLLNNKKFTNILPEEEIRSLFMDVDTNIKLKDVILSDVNRDKISNFIQENNKRAELLKYGLKPTNRILCYGASGCGKTYMGKALSNEMGYTMLYVDIAQSLSSGNISKKLGDIFRLGNTGRCMIFLDECDSIGWNRESSMAESGDRRRATNSLFQLMDNLTADSIVIAATNMLAKLDPAFVRRFDIKMYFSRPEMSLQESVTYFLKKGFILSKDTTSDDLNTVENRLKTYKQLSYYELQGLTERAMKRAILENTSDTLNGEKIYIVKLSWILNEVKVILKIIQR